MCLDDYSYRCPKRIVGPAPTNLYIFRHISGRSIEAESAERLVAFLTTLLTHLVGGIQKNQSH